MEIQTNLHGQAMMLTRSLLRGAVSGELRVKPRFLGRRMHAFAHAGERGSALVEMALILPMLLLLTTGMLIFGVAMNNYMQLTNAVSIGARAVANSASVSTDPCAVAYSALTAAAPGLSTSKLSVSYTFNGNPYSGPSCSSSSMATGAPLDLATGASATVTASYPLNLSIYGNQFSANNAVLKASSTELVQ